MKNLKSPLFVLVCAAALALSACRSAEDTGSVSANTFTVKLTKSQAAGGNFGAVTSTPAGISCDASCTTQTFSFPAGAIVTLRATPAATGRFVGWSGFSGCSSGRECPVTAGGGSLLELTATFVSASSNPGDLFVLTAPKAGADFGELISFDYNQPEIARTRSAITGVTAGARILGIDFRPVTSVSASGVLTPATPANAELYGLSANADGTAEVFRINTATGAVTNKFTLRASTNGTTIDTAAPAVLLSGSAWGTEGGTNLGVDFNPVADSTPAAVRPASLRVVSSAGQNLRVNVTNGATVQDTALSNAGVSAAAYTNNYAAAKGTVLYVVNSTQNKLFIQNTPNSGTLSEVGSLNLPGNASSFSGFDIRGTGSSTDESQYALLVAKVGAARFLYSINLATGNTTIISGPVNPVNTVDRDNPLFDDIVGFAAQTGAPAAPAREGDTLALTNDGRLLSFDRESNTATGDARRFGPTVLHRQNVIAYTPAIGDDRLVDIDVRPQDGRLYGVSARGKLYEINTLSALAVQVATLNAPLSGDHFGMDFDPRSETFRVVSDNGQNLAFQLNGALVPGAPAPSIAGANPENLLSRCTAARSATAAAYSHSLAGAGNSTLYAIDAVRGTLGVIRTNSTVSRAISDTDTTCGSPSTANGRTLAGSPGQIYDGPSSGQLLGVATESDFVRGFDIDAESGIAYAVLKTADGGVNKTRLYKINLGTGLALGAISGAATSNNDNIGLAGDQDIIGLALKQPIPVVFGLTASNSIIAFSPLTPGTLPVPAKAVGGGETLQTLDYRPVDKQLYGVTATGKICVIKLEDALSLSTTSVTPLCQRNLFASAGDTTPPAFASLDSTAASFAADFYPKRRTSDPEPVTSLRLVNSSRENISTVVVSGSTDKDTNLRVVNADTSPIPIPLPIPGAPDTTCDHSQAAATPFDVGGLAYSTIISDTTEPDLFVIGLSNTSSCTYKADAATGQLTRVGPLGPTLNAAPALMGFDIAGGDNALPLAALDVGAVRSRLYNINVGSAGAGGDGSASDLLNTPDPLIGPVGTAKIRALTIYLAPPVQ